MLRGYIRGWAKSAHRQGPMVQVQKGYLMIWRLFGIWRAEIMCRLLVHWKAAWKRHQDSNLT